MIHHFFGPHFLGAPVFPGIPNFVLLLLIIAAFWYFARKRHQTVDGSLQDSTIQGEDPQRQLRDQNEALQKEIEYLRRQNELLQTLLERQVKREGN